MILMHSLRTFLLADVDIATLVGTRVYPMIAPQGETRDRLVITPISDVRQTQLSGPASLAWPRYQVTAWSTTFNGAETLGAFVRQRLDQADEVWTDGASPATTVRVQIRHDNTRHGFDPDVSGGHWAHIGEFILAHGTAGGVV